MVDKQIKKLYNVRAGGFPGPGGGGLPPGAPGGPGLDTGAPGARSSKRVIKCVKKNIYWFSFTEIGKIEKKEKNGSANISSA